MKYCAVALLFGACVLGVYSGLHPDGFLFALGIHPVPVGTPWTYQFLSGFVPALAIVTIFGGVVSIVRGFFKKNNCHVDRCWRIGRYSVAGGAYVVCHKHHPEAHVREGRTTLAHIKLAHEAHKETHAASQA